MKTINIKLLMLVATFLVILLHATAPSFYDFHRAWSVSVFYTTLGHIAFPLFLMIAGYVSLNKNESLLSTLKTRVLNLVIPLVVWSVIYTVYARLVNGNSQPISMLDVFSEPVYYHLWFIYTLILLYLLTPLLNTFIQNGSRQRINYTLIVWFVLASVYVLFDNVKKNLLEGKAEISFSNIDMVVYLSGFYIFGGVVRRFNINPNVTIATVGFILSTMLTSVMTYSLSICIQAPDDVFSFYSAPTIVAVSVSAFFMLLNARFSPGKKSITLIRFLSRLSAGVFFIHVIVLETLLRLFDFNFNDYAAVLLFPLVALATYALSAVICWLLRLVPWLRKIA